MELQQDITPIKPVGRSNQTTGGYRNVILILSVILGVLVLFYFLINRPPQPVEKAPTLGFQHILSIYGYRADRLARPTEVAVDSAKNIYVADTNNHRILVFDENGGYVRQFGRSGDEKGEIKYPSGIAVDKKKNVFVLSRRQNKMVIYNPKGKVIWEAMIPAPLTATIVDERIYVATDRGVMIGTTKGLMLSNFGKRGSAEGDVDHPTGIAVDDKGHVYVADSMNYRVQAFDKDGKSLWVVGKAPAKRSSGELKDDSRTFALPAGLTLGGDGNLYMVDAQTGEIVVLTTKGVRIGKFGDWGRDDGQFYYPAGISYMGDDLFVIADKFNDRVQVVRYTTRQTVVDMVPGGLPILLLILLLLAGGGGLAGRWYWRRRRLNALSAQPSLQASGESSDLS